MTTAGAGPTTTAPAGRQVRLLASRILLMVVRDPWVWLPNLISTVLFLLIFDGMLGGAAGIGALTGGNYLDFLLPVIILMAALAGGHAGFALVTDKDSGFFRRQLAMPLSRPAVVLGPMVAGAVQVLFQSVVVVVLGLLMGADPATGAGGLLVVLALALLWGLAYAGYSVATALAAETAQAAQGATMIAFIVVFLSPVLLPKAQLQPWLQAVVAVNPVTYLLEAMRSLTVEGWQAGPLLRGFGAGTALAAVMLAWSTRVARRVTARS